VQGLARAVALPAPPRPSKKENRGRDFSHPRFGVFIKLR
jgi:hypothetical protein